MTDNSLAGTNKQFDTVIFQYRMNAIATGSDAPRIFTRCLSTRD